MHINLSHTIEQNGQPSLQFMLDVTVDIQHKIVGVFGPSGAGKSTFLKIIAGLVPDAHYSLQIEDKHYSNIKGHYNPCVYVGADSPLFDHLNVAENLALVVRHSKSRSRVQATDNTAMTEMSLSDVSNLCGLEKLLSQWPWQLSSGEKQRVGFARALLSGKKIMLLDEAFSALDWATRQFMHRALNTLVTNHGYMAIMVSHSLKELSLCVSTLLTVEQGKLVAHAPIASALSEHLESSASPYSEHNPIFSVINATFSHIDEQDSSLHVWSLQSIVAHSSQNTGWYVYVKSPLAHDTMLTHNSDSALSYLPRIGERISFALDANQVSVSRHPHNQTSMLNSFAVVITDIVNSPAGVVLSATWQQQTLRAMITQKSCKALDIRIGDNLFFLCKALQWG